MLVIARAASSFVSRFDEKRKKKEALVRESNIVSARRIFSGFMQRRVRRRAAPAGVGLHHFATRRDDEAHTNRREKSPARMLI